MTKQLKPCPFCGSTDLFINDVDYRFNEVVPEEQRGIYKAVVCYECNARGSEEASEAEAVMRWNTRIAHPLKILPEYFNEVVSGNKKSEIRYNDRNYRVGDILSLKEWDSRYSGRHVEVRITHILDDEDFLQNGYVMLSFELIGRDDTNNGERT